MFSPILSNKPAVVRECLITKDQAKLDENLNAIAKSGTDGLDLKSVSQLIEENFHLSWEMQKFPCTLPKIVKKMDQNVAAKLLPTLRFMASLALERERVAIIDNPTLKANIENSLTFTKENAAIIVASIMLGVTPLEHIWFSVPVCAQKVNCLITYFDRIKTWKETDDEKLRQNITILRRVIRPEDVQGEFNRSKKLLSNVHYYPKGKIEDFAHDSIQADFANKYIGGGALEHGNVQEEIMFTVQPELLTSMLFCDPMRSHEAILIIGAEVYAKHGGYGGMFHYGEPQVETGETDSLNRFKRSVTALDATIMYNWRDNFADKPFHRDLIKAYAAFSGDETLDQDYSADSDRKMPICTGKWGCGMFGGDPEVKFIQQWLAASLAGREMKFMGFSERALENAPEVVEAVMKAQLTVMELYIWTLSSLHNPKMTTFNLLENLKNYAQQKLESASSEQL